MLEIASAPSLDLRWLKPPKDTPLPIVIRGDFGWSCAGYYTHPALVQDTRYDCPLPLRNGIIAVNTCPEIQDGSHWVEAETIAHEYRHHQQFLRGLLGDGWIPENWLGDYDSKLRAFFRRNPHEQDAVAFTARVVGTHTELANTVFERLRFTQRNLTRLF